MQPCFGGRGKATQEASRTAGEGADARQKLKKLEELETKDEELWKAAGEDLEGAMATGTAIRDRITKWFMEKGSGFAEVAGKTIFCHVSAIRGGTGMGHRRLGEQVMLTVMEDRTRPTMGL